MSLDRLPDDAARAMRWIQEPIADELERLKRKNERLERINKSLLRLLEEKS